MSEPQSESRSTPTSLPRQRAEVSAVRDVLAAAFADDPMFRWMFPDPGARPHAVAAWLGVFAEAFAASATIDVVRDAAGQVAGVGLWRLDDAPLEFPEVPGVGGLLLALLGPERTPEVGTGLGGFAAHKPEPPFHYLQFLAVHPRSQGSGIGRQLLAAGQQRAAAAGQGVYLESTNASNLAFYRSSGMQPAGEFALAEPGPVAYRLWWSP